MRSWFALAVFLVACDKGGEPPAPSSQSSSAQETGPRRKKGVIDQETMEAAEMFFAQTCASCHGIDGTGNGPASTALNPKPRNYTDPKWQASVTDEQIKAIVTKGGAGVGKSASMMAFPQLAEKPAMLDAIVKIVRNFGKSGSAAP